MEQTIRQRRFVSLSARRKQKVGEAHIVYESMNTAPACFETFPRKDGEESNTNSTSSSPSSSPERNASAPAETLSDISVTTPSGMPITASDVKQRNESSNIFFEAANLKLILPSMSKETSAPSPKPVLAASLSKPFDFSFDSCSKAMSVPEAEPLELDNVEVFEVLEAACTPIEVATPITYIRPNRPSMISIFNILDKDSVEESKRPSTAKPQLPLRNPERPMVNKRLSIVSNLSGFAAGEATPLQVPDLPEDALTMISNASQTDLSIPSRHQDTALKKQKSGISLFSKAFKYGHARMTSRAHSTSPPADPSRPRSQHGVFASMLGPTATAKLPLTSSNLPNELPARPQPQQARHIHSNSVSSRPQTAASRASSAIPAIGVTALPLCTESLSHRSGSIVVRPQPLPLVGHTSRKKSISALRSRSDSIGNSLMSITGKSSAGRSKGRNVAKEALASPSLRPEPQIPLLVQSARPSFDLGAFPTPPVLSRPQNDRRSVINFSRSLGHNSISLQGYGVAVN